MTTKVQISKPISLNRMKQIIKQNKKYLSLYRGKFMAFDKTTGEFVRWDNTQVKILKAIQRWEENPSNLFIYGVPLIV